MIKHISSLTKEFPLPVVKDIGHLYNLLFSMELTRHSMVGYVLGLDRSRNNEHLVSHIYKGEYDELEKGMCPRAYDKYGGFSIFRNNITRGICRTCLKNTLKDIQCNK